MVKRFRLLTQAHSFLLFTFVCGGDNLAGLISFEFSRAEIENRTTHVCIAGKRTAIYIQKKAAKEWSRSSCLGAIIDMSVPTKRRNPPSLLFPSSGSLQSPRAPNLLPRVQRAGISNITAKLDIYHCVSHIIPTTERDQTKTQKLTDPFLQMEAPLRPIGEAKVAAPVAPVDAHLLHVAGAFAAALVGVDVVVAKVGVPHGPAAAAAAKVALGVRGHGIGGGLGGEGREEGEGGEAHCELGKGLWVGSGGSLGVRGLVVVW